MKKAQRVGSSQTGRTGRSDAVCGRKNFVVATVKGSLCLGDFGTLSVCMTCGASHHHHLSSFCQSNAISYFHAISDILSYLRSCSRVSTNFFAQTTPRNAAERTIVSFFLQPSAECYTPSPEKCMAHTLLRKLV
jgi:hypothetical protein